MKTKFINILILLLAVLSWSSCKKTSPATFSGKNYIEFYSASDIKVVTAGASNFYYVDASKSTDTVWLRVVSLGNLSTNASYINLKAFSDPTTVAYSYPEAVAGVQYVPFDDESLKKSLKLDAGKSDGYIPIVLKRDPSLVNNIYQLRFKLDNSNDFYAGNPKRTEGVILISNGLSQASNWTIYFFLGTYGKVKHQFMVEHSGERWDQTFIATVLSNSNLQTYYKYKFIQELKVLNAERIAAGLTELRENPADPTTAVTFPSL